MPVWAIVGGVIAGIALIAILVTLVWGEKSTPGDGFVSEMNEAQRRS